MTAHGITSDLEESLSRSGLVLVLWSEENGKNEEAKCDVQIILIKLNGRKWKSVEENYSREK